MKIKLYVQGKSDSLTDLIPYEQTKSGKIPQNREFCQFIQALELSDDFQRDIEAARRKLDVPTDIADLEGYIAADITLGMPAENWSWLGEEKMLDEFSVRLEVLDGLASKYGFDEHIGRSALEQIIGGYFAVVPFGKIYHELGNRYDNYNSLTLTITTAVSKYELLKYIERNWNGISKDLKSLQVSPSVYLSDRDKRIIILRDKEQLTYRAIADRIIDELGIDNADGSVNEDTVKSAYNRAKKKIQSLAKGNTTHP